MAADLPEASANTTCVFTLETVEYLEVQVGELQNSVELFHCSIFSELSYADHRKF